MTDRHAIEAHLLEHQTVVRAVADAMADDIGALADGVLATIRRGGKILFCGNGGSAGDVQHLAAEYVVRFARERGPIAAMALTADGAVLTAAGNDYGFDRVFERQVRAIGCPADILVIHSTSGQSKNLLLAAEAARALGMTTAALLANDGGQLAHVVDQALVVPTRSVARAQEVHVLIGHIVCDLVDRALIGAGGDCRGKPGHREAATQRHTEAGTLRCKG